MDLRIKFVEISINDEQAIRKCVTARPEGSIKQACYIIRPWLFEKPPGVFQFIFGYGLSGPALILQLVTKLSHGVGESLPKRASFWVLALLHPGPENEQIFGVADFQLIKGSETRCHGRRPPAKRGASRAQTCVASKSIATVGSCSVRDWRSASPRRATTAFVTSRVCCSRAPLSCACLSSCAKYFA